MDEWYEEPGLWIIIILLLMVGLVSFCSWQAAGVNAKLYNQKFGTQYSQRDFFWSESTIKSFLNQGQQNTQNIKIEGAIPVSVK